ncbi:hypothetical protein [Actinophytocola oryzae]|uniref:Uncharacterized protein n=1 Tax=Actinophytocola oryzae TaxID=502181 RepID=A0A4V3FQK9_9PSEU|nr:hypothetical protein [Actinophytocola oryzae]TDV40071.1 hypothetical protein CLV71_12488 [Actinophytocola oryzae]
MNPDAISVKFEHLQDLRQAILTAQNSLATNRGDWMSFTTNTMAMGWADEAGDANQFRNADFSKYGEENELFLQNLMQAVENAEQELRGAVQRARTAIQA